MTKFPLDPPQPPPRGRDEAALAAALQDTRAALRLLVGWQQRMNAIFRDLDDALQARGLHYGGWWTERYNAPMSTLTASKKPFQQGTWAWDLFPGASLTAVWQSKASPTLRVVAQVELDGALPWAKHLGGEPDPFAMIEVSDRHSTSDLWIGCTTASDGPAANDQGGWTQILKAYRPRWTDGLAGPVPWQTDRTSGTYSCIRAPLFRLIDSTAVAEHVLRPTLRWVERAPAEHQRHAPS